jgi:hypothetical protein
MLFNGAYEREERGAGSFNGIDVASSKLAAHDSFAFIAPEPPALASSFKMQPSNHPRIYQQCFFQKRIRRESF